MMNPATRRVLVTCVLAIGMIASGCAKKSMQAPPTPPAPPAQKETPATPPKGKETKDETPAPSKVIGSGDFEPAFFDLDAYVLRDDARTALDHDGKLLRDNAGVKLTIEGHCDERGTAEYNQALGEKRAQAARDYLVNAGIEGSRLQVISYGKERPFDTGHDDSAWSKNRRANFVTR